MHDPFPIPPSAWLSKAVQPFADYFSLTTLPLHVHEVVIGFLGYSFINIVVSPWLSSRLFPAKYAALSPTRRLNWDVHVVSLCQSTLINTLALYVMFVDEDRKNMDWRQRVWGYTGAAGMIQGLATGYFLWDLAITVRHLKVFGVGMLAHAISALIVFSFGFRPFLNFYGSTFILYELSSPFLNFHWFFDKLDMTGSTAQLYNGVLLLGTFFSCRLVWGNYQSVRVYQDVWAALHHVPAGPLDPLAADAEMMRFAGQEQVPLWLALCYLASNITLNGLNFYWFGQMIEAITKRFRDPADVPTQPDAKVDSVSSEVLASGATKVSLDEVEIRKRVKAAQVPIGAVA